MPIRHFYSKGIVLYGWEGKALNDGNAMNNQDSHAFFDLTTKLLDDLSELKVGRKLLAAVDDSGKICTIFKAGIDPGKATQQEPRYDSVTTSNPPGVTAEFASSVKHFAPRHHILPLNFRGNPTGNNSVVTNMAAMTPKQIFNKPQGLIQYDNSTQQAQGYKQELQQAGLPTSKSQVASELTTVLKRTPFWMTRSYVAKKAGIGEKQLKQIEAGQIGLNQETYYRLAILLYDYMTPGTGSDTAIRFRAKDHEEDVIGSYNPTTNYADAPGFVVLGHELIHAWRMMTGRRLVRQGWEEEAMTTGLYKWSELEFTENKLRAEAKLPARPKYQKGYCSSQWMDMVAYHNSNS
jgi:hypothetical protein